MSGLSHQQDQSPGIFNYASNNMIKTKRDKDGLIVQSEEDLEITKRLHQQALRNAGAGGLGTVGRGLSDGLGAAGDMFKGIGDGLKGGFDDFKGAFGDMTDLMKMMMKLMPLMLMMQMLSMFKK